jgi:hypothetical protein
MSVPLLGHALHVCATGAVASCACAVCCGAGVRWAKLDLAWGFGSPGHVGAVLRKQPAFLRSWRRRSSGGGEGQVKIRSNGDKGQWAVALISLLML